MLAIPLDALELPAVDVIQLDCEGSEDKALRGAFGTIKNHLPVISIEAPNEKARSILGFFKYREVGRCGSLPDVVFASIA